MAPMTLAAEAVAEHINRAVEALGTALPEQSRTSTSTTPSICSITET